MSVATATRQMGAHRRIHAYHDIGAILGAGGANYAIIPLGDSKHESADRTTVTVVSQGAGPLGLVFTYSEARTAFDKATRYRHNQLWLPEVPFNGIDEEADASGVSFWSRVSLPFSVGCWVNLVDTQANGFLSKYDTVSNTREWVFYSGTLRKLRLQLFDESVSGNPAIFTTSDTELPAGVLLFLVGTFSGSDDAVGINLYQNGALLPSTDTENASFVALEDLSGKVKLGHWDVIPTSLVDGSYLGGPLGPFFTHLELTAAQIAELYRLGMAAQG